MNTLLLLAVALSATITESNCLENKLGFRKHRRVLMYNLPRRVRSSFSRNPFLRVKKSHGSKNPTHHHHHHHHMFDPKSIKEWIGNVSLPHVSLTYDNDSYHKEPVKGKHFWESIKVPHLNVIHLHPTANNSEHKSEHCSDETTAGKKIKDVFQPKKVLGYLENTTVVHYMEKKLLHMNHTDHSTYNFYLNKTAIPDFILDDYKRQMSGTDLNRSRESYFAKSPDRKVVTKIRIDIDEHGRKHSKHRFRVNMFQQPRPINGQRNVLETAGEVATDLAGRASGLWHCVLTHHHETKVEDIKFYLYTRKDTINPELININFDTIRSKSNSKVPSRIECFDLVSDDVKDFIGLNHYGRHFIKSNHLNLQAPTKILIHGYNGSRRDRRITKIKDAYLRRGRYNVVEVDWSLMAAPPCYTVVAQKSRFVGETIARFLDGLALSGVNMSLVHLIGFSLGAQIAGFAGNNVTKTKPCRITGLDPALPLFLHGGAKNRLDKEDAEFVDVIHTCGGFLAMLDPLGHVDFYPNGGTRQPGCELSDLKCSHNRAPQYFAESIVLDQKFKGTACSSWESYSAGNCTNGTWALMGEPCSIKSQEGSYYLSTKSTEPFAL